MFLLTFALLIISMLGVYTQVYALEAARLFASQTGVAETMLEWHYAAASLAANVVEPATVGGMTGCRLSPNAWAGSPAICKTGPSVTLPSVNATVIGGPYTFGTASVPYLPPQYNTTTYQWNSITFQSGTAYYVVTFVAAPGATPVSTATSPATQLNITEGDLYHQLQNLGVPAYAFGYVSSATLNAGPSGAAAVTHYTVPTSIPNGALAIISFPGQCNGC